MTDQNNPNRVNVDTAEEAVAAWNAGKEIATIEMGGLSKGYEMAIQVTAFAIMEALLAEEAWLKVVREYPTGQTWPDGLRQFVDGVISEIDKKDEETGRFALGGLSGAQAGAATNLALNVVRNGFQNGRDQVGNERIIWLSKSDPVELFNSERQGKSALDFGIEQGEKSREREKTGS